MTMAYLPPAQTFAGSIQQPFLFPCSVYRSWSCYVRSACDFPGMTHRCSFLGRKRGRGIKIARAAHSAHFCETRVDCEVGVAIGCRVCLVKTERCSCLTCQAGRWSVIFFQKKKETTKKMIKSFQDRSAEFRAHHVCPGS